MKDYFKSDKWHPDNHQPNVMEVWRWELLKRYILNPLREYLDVPVYITNGLRTQATFDRLIREGYHPSETSDHFWGSPVCLWSTAAVDITWDEPKAGKSYEQVLQAIKDGNVPGMTEPGQVIWESQKGKSDWLHISLPKWIVFGGILAGKMPWKGQYLRGIDGRYRCF